MPSPFPGMNPYLEHPDRWSTAQNRLIVALADFLTPELLPKYQVDIEKRIYEVIGLNTLLVGRADVSVQQSKDFTQAERIATGVSAIAQPIKVSLPMPEEVREAYLEVKEVATQAVITTIEILSPTNKRGNGREKYENKRQQVLNSQTHLVEIDLLREGKPLPTGGDEITSDYRILVSRSDQRPIADLYAFNVPDAIPLFPLPLKIGDIGPIVNLKELLEGVYERSGYDYFINYGGEVIPPLAINQANWLDQLLQNPGLRANKYKS